ncbi:MAG: YkgJ family cysteine cluster protein [Candidatus Bathyarchaeaceae archaeon]
MEKVKGTQRQNDFFPVCSKCKLNCCQNARPPIIQKRKKIIESYLATQGLRIKEPFNSADYIFPRETTDGFCILFDKKSGKCLVHPVKPETCIAGPITFDINPQTGKIEWFLKFESICSVAGILYRDKEALEKHLSSARKALQTLVQELDAKALRAILKIEEPETFKIGEDSLSPRVLEKITKYK